MLIFKNKLINIFLITLFLGSFILPFTASANSLSIEQIGETELNGKASIEIKATVVGYKLALLNTGEINFTVTDSSNAVIEEKAIAWKDTDLSTTYTSGSILSIGSSYQVKAELRFYTSGSGNNYSIKDSEEIDVTASPLEKWWYIYKTVGATGNFKGCTTPNSFASEQLCLNSENLAVDDTHTILMYPSTGCAQSDTKPIAPKECLHAIEPDAAALNTNTDYYPLAPLPGVGEKTCTQDKSVPPKTICVKTTPAGSAPSTGFGNYLNAMIKIFIGICAVLAMIMIIMGGIEYMTSELVSSKEAGKSKITNAVMGLLLALGAFALLNTINPDLLNISLGGLPTATITITPGQIAGDSGSPSTFTSTDLSGSGVTCTNSGGINALVSTASSFNGKVTYSLQWPFGYNENDQTIYSNCSTFVNQVYNCVGLASPGGNADTMFQNQALSEPVSSVDSTGTKVNGVALQHGVALQQGDLLGWETGENGAEMGHVFMYIGNGNIIDVHGPSGIKNKAVGLGSGWTVLYYNNYVGGGYKGNNIKHIIRVKNIGQATITPSASSTSGNVSVIYNATTKKVSINISDYVATSTYTYKLLIGQNVVTTGKITGKTASANVTTLYEHFQDKATTTAVYKDGVGIATVTFILK